MSATAVQAAAAEESDAVLDHAGFRADETRLWLCSGFAQGDGSVACYFKPVMDIDDDHGLFTPEQRVEVESEACRPLHRIGLFEDYAEGQDLGETLRAVTGALLRHELEHARQQLIAGNDALDIDREFLDDAMRQRVGGLPEGSNFYNFKPTEMDANAAAAMYLRAQHPEHVEAILVGPHGQLARSLTPPESPETLLARTVGVLYAFRDVCEQKADPLPFAKYLRAYSTDAERLWAALDESPSASAR